MTAREHTDARALLADLLDRCEARPGAVRLLAHLDHEGFASAAALDACLAELAAFEQAGAVSVRRQRRDGIDRVLHVRLADAAAAYRILGRMPSADRALDTIERLRAVYENTEIQALLTDVQAAWSRNVSAFVIAPDQEEDLRQTLDLALRLQSRDAGTTQDFRTFSRLAVGDSKALDRLSASVRTVLDRLGAEIAPDPAEPFAAFGVVRLPAPFLVSGRLRLAGQRLPSLSYVGLDPIEALRLEPDGRPDYMLTIENFTSFVRHVREVNATQEGLVIYTGGFPSRAALDAIVTLAVKARTQVFHWGDLDQGGVRIFAHLERALAIREIALAPHLMSPALLSKATTKRRNATRGLSDPPGKTAIGALWRALRADQMLELEQEAIDPHPPTTLKFMEPDLPRCLQP